MPKQAGDNLNNAREYVRQRSPTSDNPGDAEAFSNLERERSSVCLMTSRDLRSWEIQKVMLYHPNVSRHGFQYPDFVFNGDDIIFVSRTSYDDESGRAENQHNAN